MLICGVCLPAAHDVYSLVPVRVCMCGCILVVCVKVYMCRCVSLRVCVYQCVLCGSVCVCVDLCWSVCICVYHHLCVVCVDLSALNVEYKVRICVSFTATPSTCYSTGTTTNFDILPKGAPFVVDNNRSGWQGISSRLVLVRQGQHQGFINVT